MTDLALSWNGREADLVIEDGDFALDDSLQTPVIISLFSDRRARPDDAWPDVPADLIGSRLWLLRREKEIAETLRRAREYGKESVAWTLDDGIAAKVEVTASVPKRGVLRLQVVISRRNGQTENYQYDTLWETLQ